MTYDKVLKEELWFCFRRFGVAEKNVRAELDLDESRETAVRCALGATEELRGVSRNNDVCRLLWNLR